MSLVVDIYLTLFPQVQTKLGVFLNYNQWKDLAS